MSTLRTARIGQIVFHPSTRRDALDHIFGLSAKMESRWVVTSNTDHLLRAGDDEQFRASVAACDFVVSDGWPVVLTLRLMGFADAERVTGSDLLPAIAERCARTGKTIFIMGGMEGWAEQAAVRLTDQYPGLEVVGTFCPPFGFERDVAVSEAMVAAINAAQPDFLFLGVSAPKQENWIREWRSKFKCGVVLGVGMAIGFSAGAVPRAPIMMQKLGLEWFYRMCSEPRRLAPRYAKDLLVFPDLVRAVLKRGKS